MRKRHVAQPVLEMVEDRMVLSVAGAGAHAAEVIAARAARLGHAAAVHAATAHHAKSEVASPQQHASKITHAAHHSTAKPKKSSSNTLSSLLLKSIFPF
jgi:hypothetical protein